ncbi:MAG: FadR family transcriptional regulator [Desulfuromusa sp.]|nr:FadR family transcriptional regulator [Desulfuromusa sp.]
MSVVDTVLEEIGELELVEGSRLPSERKLAEKCAISRSSVRTALKELQSRRVLAVRQGSGYFLSSGFALQQALGGKDLEWDMDRIKQVLAARGFVAAHVAEMSSRNMTAVQLEGLEDCLVDLGKAIISVDIHAIELLHGRFINIIQGSCSNREFIRMLNEVRIPSHYIINILRMAEGEERNAFFSWHVNLFQAIKKKNHSLAREVSERMSESFLKLFTKYSHFIEF